MKCLGSVLSALLWHHTCFIIVTAAAPRSCSLARFSNKQKTSHFFPARFCLQCRLWPMMLSVCFALGEKLLCCKQGQIVCSRATQLSFFFILLKAGCFHGTKFCFGCSTCRRKFGRLNFKFSYSSFVNCCDAKLFSCVLPIWSFKPPESLENTLDWILSVTEGSPPGGALCGALLQVGQTINLKRTQSGLPVLLLWAMMPPAGYRGENK